MKIKSIISIFLLSSLIACGDKAGEVGAECTTNDDCAEGLECEMHEGETDHGSCAEHSDHDHEDEDHSDETEES